MNRERVAVVVVTYHSERLLPEFIGSLASAAGQEVDLTLVAVDNDSSDQTVAVLRSLAPDALIVEMGRNAGYAAGINAGVQAAGDHDAYLVVNPDVRLGPGCLPQLLHTLAEPGVGIAVPHLVDGDGNLILSMRREPSLLRAFGDLVLGAERAGWIPALGEMVVDPEAYRHRTSTDWAEGSTQLVSRACWAQCGPWDDRFFLYSEEADFDLRAGDLGLRTVYDPAADAVHLEGGSATSPALWALLQVNRVRLYGRRHRRVATAAFWLLVLLREVSRSALGRPPSRAAVRALTSPRCLRETPGPHSIATQPAPAGR